MRSIKKLIKFFLFLIFLVSVIIAVGVYYPSPKLPDVGFRDAMLIQQVNIVDVENGQIYPQQNVLLEQGKIVNISSDNIRPKDKLIIIIDGTDRYLIPGLWDMHSQSIKRSPYIHHPLYIANGVTHLRDLSGCLHKDDAYWACTDEREKWNRLALNGTQLSPIYHQQTVHPLAGGNEIPDDFPNYLKSNVTEKANGLVQYAKSQNADFLTIEKGLKRSVYFGIALEAQNNQIGLVGKIPFNASLPDVLSAKQQSIDEATIFSFACYNNARKLSTANNTNKYDTTILQDIVSQQDPIKCSTLMTTMATSNTWWSPNLQDLKYKFANNNSKNNKYIPLLNRYVWEKIIPTESISTSARDAHEGLFILASQQINKAKQSGVKIMAGSNAYGNNLLAGKSLHSELIDMVDGGLTPLQALQSATYNPAVFAGESENYGSIRIGKQADLVLLNANPLNNINALDDIEAVITQERYIDREELDKLLTYTEKQAKNWHQNIKLFWENVSSPVQRKVLSDARERASKSK